MFFLTQSLWATLGRRRRLPGLLGGANMILGHCGLVRDCVWPSGDALAAPRGRRRRRTVRDTHTKPIQFNFHVKQSTLKIDDFFDFPKIFTTGSAPRVVRSTSLLLALRSSRR